MSDLQRTAALNAKLAKLSASLPSEDAEEEEEMDGLGSLPSTFNRPLLPKRKVPNPEYAPLSASGYFEQAVEVDALDTNTKFRVYLTLPKVENGTIMVCHHGAGYSGLSFALFAKEVMNMTAGECGVLAFDARRHGKTFTDGPDDDLSVDVLAHDMYGLLRTVFPNPKEAPTFLLIGHSMGGSVVVRVCPMLLEKQYKVTGVAVLDVVEGSAIEALPHMHKLLNSRPDGFDSLEAAIEWHVSNRTIRNPVSARISVPALMVPSSPSAPSRHPFTWRTPLRSTAPYWEGWFSGLSKLFLAARTARILILAGTDRLDKELIIGQMQGKFQLVVVPDTGHMMQEDNPEKLAQVLVEFWRRNERVIVGVKKVGEM